MEKVVKEVMKLFKTCLVIRYIEIYEFLFQDRIFLVRLNFVCDLEFSA